MSLCDFVPNPCKLVSMPRISWLCFAHDYAYVRLHYHITEPRILSLAEFQYKFRMAAIYSSFVLKTWPNRARARMAHLRDSGGEKRRLYDSIKKPVWRFSYATNLLQIYGDEWNHLLLMASYVISNRSCTSEVGSVHKASSNKNAKTWNWCPETVISPLKTSRKQQ